MECAFGVWDASNGSIACKDLCDKCTWMLKTTAACNDRVLFNGLITLLWGSNKRLFLGGKRKKIPGYLFAGTW